MSSSTFGLEAARGRLQVGAPVPHARSPRQAPEPPARGRARRGPAASSTRWAAGGALRWTVCEICEFLTEGALARPHALRVGVGHPEDVEAARLVVLQHPPARHDRLSVLVEEGLDDAGNVNRARANRKRLPEDDIDQGVRIGLDAVAAGDLAADIEEEIGRRAASSRGRRSQELLDPPIWPGSPITMRGRVFSNLAPDSSRSPPGWSERGLANRISRGQTARDGPARIRPR